MKPFLFPSVITVLLLARTAHADGQVLPSTTEQPSVSASSGYSKENRKDLKHKRKERKQKKNTSPAFNPYQPPSAPVKPLPYNSYREHPAPLPEGGLSNTLREAINDKKLYKKKN